VRKRHRIKVMMPLNMFKPSVQNCSKGTLEGAEHTSLSLRERCVQSPDPQSTNGTAKTAGAAGLPQRCYLQRNTGTWSPFVTERKLKRGAMRPATQHQRANIIERYSVDHQRRKA